MKNMFPYIYDFLSLVFEDKETKDKIRRVILFGSVAAGEFDKESDIDIFIDLWTGNNIKSAEASLKEADKRFLSASSKKWSLLGIRQPIKCIVGTLNDTKWRELKREMVSNGMLLYGKFEEAEEGLKHYSMFSYSLARLSQNKKMGFLRKLFGYKTAKGKKEYRRPGLLEEIGGVKLSSNVILVPVENSRKIHKFLISHRIMPEIREVRIR